MRGVYEKVKGSKDFYIRYTDDEGLRHREHVGPENQACETLIDRRREIREGGFAAPLSRRREIRQDRVVAHSKGRITFEELFELRMAAKPLSWGTIRQYRCQLAMMTDLREMPVRKIRPEDIEKFLNTLRQKGKTNFTVNNYRSLIGAVLAHGVAREHLSSNPVLKTDPAKQSQGRVRFLSLDEEQAIRNELRKGWPPEREAEFDLLLNTGMRIGEIWNLRWEGVHPDRDIIEVPKEGKTGYRPIAMNASCHAAVRTLHKQSRGSSFVVPNVYAKRGRRYLALWVGQAAKKAGVDGVSPHVLRHTFASRLVMAGVNLRRVQEYLGHKSIDMTMKYAHLSPENPGKSDIERLVTFGAVAPAAAAKPPVRVKKPAAGTAAKVRRIA
jgi:site-specific recombinase XerD